MTEIRNFINKLSKSQKITCLILILGFILLLSVGIPTLARFKNRSTIVSTPVWDGSIASSYRKGTGSEADPYIISNGSELAYFYTQLSNNKYENTYFALSNDIILNNGIFNYSVADGIKYIISNQTYYVGGYSNKYYDNVDMIGTEIGTINTFNPLDGFMGHLNGNSFTIYGLYITDSNRSELALFTNLQGDVHDLYVDNSLVYGGTTTAGIASTTNNASLSNILFNGYVVGKNTELAKNINTTATAPVINLQSTPKTDYIDLTNNIPFIGSEITSTSITGDYVINGSSDAETSIKINGVTVTNGSFEIDLGNSILENISVLTSTISEGNPTITFSNLSYNIVYNYAVSGGIIANSNNTTIENTINKAFVYGYSISGGLVGVTISSLSINQSYNVGSINSQYVSGGLAGTIEKSTQNISISKSYNTGDMVASDIGGLIGNISSNTGSVSISNIFNTSSTNYSIGTIEGTTVNITNAYFVNGTSAINNGTANGDFTLTTMSNLKTKSYVTSNLAFNEFVSFDDLASNNQNVWVYESESLPILFVDDISNPIANMHVGVYTWNNLSHELSTVKLNSSIAFNIEAADELRPIKEIYYYISNSSSALTSGEISGISTWNLYSGIVEISNEGNYVIYAKIVDYNDNITYMNTDLLVLDLSTPTVSVSINDNNWTSLRDNLGNVYIDRPSSVKVVASDDLSGVATVKYYATNQVLSTSDLNALSDNSWSTYYDGILISEIGKHIIYVQVIDNCDHITYANTDYITLDGYTQNSLIVGRNPPSYLNEATYVTDKSTITLNISYAASSASELNNYTHNLMSNILLPMGTRLTLIDYIKGKVYEYKITTSEDIYNYNNSCDAQDLDCIKAATYPFTLFNEVGAVGKPYLESTYYDSGSINENFTIVLDLSNTSIATNYSDVNLYMELHDADGINVRPTLFSTIKYFNIYSNISGGVASANLYLTTDYSGNTIAYNSNSSTNININSGISYKYVSGFKVIDTRYENKEIGLSVKLVDGEGNTIDKEYLKNIIFKIGENIYYPEEDNIVRIDLENGINDISKALTIITSENNSDLAAGTYYFKINNYASFDGHYYNELNDTAISIPVKVIDNDSKIKYSFDVIMNDTNRIISKTSSTVNVSFNILQNGSLKDPNIRVSLYKKDQLTAYNQSYSIVDLAGYVSDSLNNCSSNVYYVSTNPVKYNKYTKLYNNFVLNLMTANFENDGYKFVFDLYDGTKKIGTIEKHFIVK
jgi:hypothetical protein